MRRTVLALFFLSAFAFAQSPLTVLDAASVQMRLYRRAPAPNHRMLIDSVYRPFEELWQGYLGTESDFLEWYDSVRTPFFPHYEQKESNFSAAVIGAEIRRVADSMQQLTGYAPRGTWWLVYGPRWTDLGGLQQGRMVIDLAHDANVSMERITMMLPHELNHQIYDIVNRDTLRTVMRRVIDEGFAVYVSRQYWKERYPLEQLLGYSAQELERSRSYEGKMFRILTQFADSTGRDQIDAFVARSQRIGRTLPGAIGYYLGYRIVEGFVAKNGPESWKRIYTVPADDVWKQSGLMPR